VASVRGRIALLLGAVISVNASYTVLIPFVPSLEERVGAGPTTIALAFALFAAAKMLAQPAGGWWVDRRHPGEVACLSLLVAVAGIALAALARAPATLLAARAIWGIGEGLVSPALYAGMSALCSRHGIPAGRMMGNFGAASVGGLLLGPLIAAAAAPVGLEALFLTGAAITAATAVGLLRAIPRPEPRAGVAAAPHARTAAPDAAGDATPAGRWWTWVLALGALDMFTALIASALEPTLPLFLADGRPESAHTAISVVFTAGLATSGLAVWGLGRFAGQVPLTRLVGAGLPVAAVGLAGMAAGPATAQVAAAFVVFMVGYALLFLTARRGVLELEAAATARGRAFGLFGMVSDVGNIAGPVIGVALYELTGRVAFVLLGLLCGLLLAVLAAASARGWPVLATRPGLAA
jgi:MFS family permease